jgi:hypothetical protein
MAAVAIARRSDIMKSFSPRLAVTMNRQRVDHCVELLCDRGCRAVWRDIQCLEAGKILPETAALSEEERRAVLQELKSVMAVYGPDGCSTD